MSQSSESHRPLGTVFKLHPWHGIPIGQSAPDVVTVYVEGVPADAVQYKFDVLSGHLEVERPQRFASRCPGLYGFAPQTQCSSRVAGRYEETATGIGAVRGDDAAMEICVLTEKSFYHGDFLCSAIPIGGLRTIDGDVISDKIIAVLEGDGVFGGWSDVGDVPRSLIDRVEHFFTTRKAVSKDSPVSCFIEKIYGYDEAHEVIRYAHEDYMEMYGELQKTLSRATSVA